MKLRKILFAMACFGLSGSGMAVSLWQDDDPASAGITTQGNGLSVSQIASTIGNSATIGQIEESGMLGAFGNMTATDDPFNVTAYQGEDYVFSFDYYVPSATVASGNDLFYIQVNVNGANVASAGFINIAGAPKDTWQTFSYTNSFTNTATSAEFLWLYVDGGFSGPQTTTPGTVLYVDNVLVTTTEGDTPPPEDSSATFDWEEFDGNWWEIDSFSYSETNNGIVMQASGRATASSGGDGPGGANGTALKAAYEANDQEAGTFEIFKDGSKSWFVVESIDIEANKGNPAESTMNPTVTGYAAGLVQWVIEPVTNAGLVTYTTATSGDLSEPIEKIVWDVGYHSNPNATFNNTIDNLKIRTTLPALEVIYNWNLGSFWTPHAIFSWNLPTYGMDLLNFDQYWWSGGDAPGTPTVIKHRPGLADLPAEGGFGGIPGDTSVGGLGNRGVYVTDPARVLVSNEILRVTYDWKMFVNGSDDGRFVDMFFSTTGSQSAKRFGQTGNELGFAWYQTQNSNDVAITFAADDDYMAVKPPVLRIPLVDLGIDVGTTDHDSDDLAITYTAQKTATANTWLCSLIVSNKATATSYSVEDVVIINAAAYNNPTYFCVYTADDLSDGDPTSGANPAGYEIDNLAAVILLNPPPAPEGYEAFLEAYGMAGQPNSGEFEDFDADGMLNIYEFGWGGDPTNDLVQGVLPELIISNGVAYYSSAELKDPNHGLVYEVLYTDNLTMDDWVSSWTTSSSGSYNEILNVVQYEVDEGAQLFFKSTINTNTP